MKIILCPGSGSGAHARRGPAGLPEHEVVDDVASLLSQALAQRLIATEIMQPPAGDAAEAAAAVAVRIADEPYDIDIVLALRTAADPDPAAYGLRVLYLEGSEDSRLLSECLLQAFPRTGWSQLAASADPLLGVARCPSVVVELDHLSNPEVEVLMREPSWRAKVAANLVDGLFSFIGPQDIRVIIDGHEVHVEPAPQVVYNDVLVPVRVLGTALGVQVRWDPRRRLVSIKTG
ncbi:MAG: N-acetylmuramoyl-L-alanine amidase [Fimbriimonadaceae bacterium]|nr:N-acetylmuramoyl-L-alanine amidase [Fimbriimonadaceae bacterium]